MEPFAATETVLKNNNHFSGRLLRALPQRLACAATATVSLLYPPDVLQFCSTSESSVNLNKARTSEPPLSPEFLIAEISPTSGRVYRRQKASRNHVSLLIAISQALPPFIPPRVRESPARETWPAFQFQRRDRLLLQIICKQRVSSGEERWILFSETPNKLWQASCCFSKRFSFSALAVRPVHTRQFSVR